MEVSTTALRTALRVLTAITDRHKPETADVQSLRTFAPLLAHEPVDELACDVIRQALQRQAAIRDAGR